MRQLKMRCARHPKACVMPSLVTSNHNSAFTQSQVLEKIMNGRLVNTKYEGATLTLDPVIIVVMANEPPNKSNTWSQDRFYTADGVSTVVDLSLQEEECDRLLATPKHRHRSLALQQAMLAFYKDVVKIDDANLNNINAGMPVAAAPPPQPAGEATFTEPPPLNEADSGVQDDDDEDMIEVPFGFNSLC